ncbi:hypothetical protein [Halomicrobium salinisoli]|uniref:hypothetical protein n=1 Tax=Halomicrobium salinisoli TaxID=2878391 RepID=UPI001CF0D157|nr:hypothetical protein [Halomicrobium salinisoli]
MDAQFRTGSWGEATIDKTLRSRLEPINAIRMANGNPDAILAPPRPDAYRGTLEDAVTALPLAVIEAKGKTEQNSQNATRIAITQAHSHMGEANIGFAAVPSDYISKTDQSLARELNIGLIAVGVDTVDLVEKPRLIGTETTPTAETVRFHAQLGDTAVESLKKNHPKNALGYALAIQHPEETEDVFIDHVINSVSDARLDAMALGLATNGLSGSDLTPTGKEVVRTVSYHYGGIELALQEIDSLTGSRRRFIDACPVMGAEVRHALLSYPPTQVLVDVLGDLAEEGNDEPCLAEVAKAVAVDRPNFALDLFVSPRSKDRERVLDEESGTINLAAFDNGEIYSTHTEFQYKAMLYHAGLLTERGTDTKSEINPATDIWALETPLER